MSVTYWSTVQTLVVQQVLLKDGFFTGQLLLGHLLQKHSSSRDSDIAFNIFWTNTSTCYLVSVYNQKGGIMNVLSLKERGKEWLLNARKVLSILWNASPADGCMANITSFVHFASSAFIIWFISVFIVQLDCWLCLWVQSTVHMYRPVWGKTGLYINMSPISTWS